MIRDLSFEEIERSVRRKRLVRLVIACVVLSTVGTFVVAREAKIRQEFAALPAAALGDLDSLRMRHDGIVAMLDQHHVWTGAFLARRELDDLVVSISAEERAFEEREVVRRTEIARTREEAEVARSRGLVLAERKEFTAAIQQLERSLELADSMGEDGWDGGEWEHREQVVIDIYALKNLGSEQE